MTPLLLLAALATADAATLDQRSAVWTQAVARIDLDDVGRHLLVDLHARERPADFQGLVRLGAGLPLAEGVIGQAGGTWVPVVPVGGDLKSAYDLWARAILGRRVGRTALAFRPWAELRFADAQPDLAVRARFMGRVAVDLTEYTHAVVWDEVLLGVNRTDWAPHGFDDNRLFAGVGIAGRPGMAVELGYLNRVTPSAMEHTALIAVVVRAGGDPG